MITAFELARLTLEGNLENEKYKILTVQPKGSFEDVLAEEVCHDTDLEDLNVCVGTLPRKGEVGYLVKMVREIPTAHNIIGAVDAIYEVDGTDDEEGCRYYAVWAIQKD